MNLFDFGKEQFKFTKEIMLIELFAGIGAQAKALERLGANFNTHVVCEFDESAIRSYNAIHHTNFKTSDITQITGKDLKIDDKEKYQYLMTYSFPCQDLSLMGKQKGYEKGSGTRSGLLWEIERLLNECKEYNGNLPDVLVMENVPQVHSDDNREDFRKWIMYLESLGYENYYQDLNAKNYGIPQNRERTFMVSLLGNYTYRFPEQQKLTITLQDLLDDDADEKYFLSPEVIQGRIKTSFRQYQLETSLVNNKKIHPTILARYDGSPTLLRVDIPQNEKIITNSRIRKLMPKETWRLMGFDDEDVENAQKVNSDAALYKQAGNSICVNVLEAVFGEML